MDTQHPSTLPDQPIIENLFGGAFHKLHVTLQPDDRYIAGYLNVANVVDNQKEKVTLEALNRAYSKWSANPEFCFIHLLHNDIPLAKVVFDPITDSAGKTHQTGVDNVGLYVVAKVRNDVQIADAVWGKMQTDPKWRRLSISGKRLQRGEECKGSVCYSVLHDFELYGGSVTPNPANELSAFSVLKDELVEVSQVASRFKDKVLIEDFIQISKTRGCNCGKYHIYVPLDIPELKEGFETEDTRVVLEKVEGMEYIPLFDLSRLRPFSLEEGLSAEEHPSGCETPSKTDEPISKGVNPMSEENKGEVNNPEPSVSQDTPPAPSAEPKPEQGGSSDVPPSESTPTSTALTREEFEGFKTDMSNKFEQILGLLKPADPVAPAVAEQPPVVEPTPTPEPVVEQPPAFEQPVDQTQYRGQPNTTPVSQGLPSGALDLASIYNLPWGKIREAVEP